MNEENATPSMNPMGQLILVSLTFVCMLWFVVGEDRPEALYEVMKYVIAALLLVANTTRLARYHQLKQVALGVSLVVVVFWVLLAGTEWKVWVVILQCLWMLTPTTLAWPQSTRVEAIRGAVRRWRMPALVLVASVGLPFLAGFVAAAWCARMVVSPVVLVSGGFGDPGLFGEQVMNHLQAMYQEPGHESKFTAKGHLGYRQLRACPLIESDLTGAVSADHLRENLEAALIEKIGKYLPCAIIAANTSSSAPQTLRLATGINVPVFIVAATKDIAQMDSDKHGIGGNAASHLEKEAAGEAGPKLAFQLVPKNASQAQLLQEAVLQIPTNSAMPEDEPPPPKETASKESPRKLTVAVLSDGTSFGDDVQAMFVYGPKDRTDPIHKRIDERKMRPIQFSCYNMTDVVNALRVGKQRGVSHWVVAMYPTLARGFASNKEALNVKGPTLYCDSAFGSWMWDRPPNESQEYIALPTPYPDTYFKTVESPLPPIDESSPSGIVSGTVRGDYAVYGAFAKSAFERIGELWEAGRVPIFPAPFGSKPEGEVPCACASKPLFQLFKVEPPDHPLREIIATPKPEVPGVPRDVPVPTTTTTTTTTTFLSPPTANPATISADPPAKLVPSNVEK